MPPSTDPKEPAEATDPAPVAMSSGRQGRLRALLYSLAAVLVVMLGAGRLPWSRGMALLVMGLVLVLAPPVCSLRRIPLGCLLALTLFGFIGLLPSEWLGGMEAWRTNLMGEWGVKLGTAFTPDWHGTLESCLLLVSGVVWLAACLGQNFSEGGRRLVLRVVVLSVLVMAVLSLLETIGWLKVSWWPRGLGKSALTGGAFGPFSNQNHSSSMFAWACVLCAAATLDAFRHGSRWVLVFGAGFFVLLSCILVNSSRAGLFLFIGGFNLWLAVVAIRHGGARKAIVMLAVVICVMSVTMVAGGRVSEKLRAGSVTEVLSSDLRVWLAEQTWNATRGFLWTGRGLGNFDFVFPQVCKEPYPDARTIHPESDVLWLLFEGGLLCVLPCLGFVGWLCFVSGPWLGGHSSGRQASGASREGRSARRIRRAFAIAAILALFHAVIDVPLHSLGYFVLFALVAAQAPRPRHAGAPASEGLRLAFRVLGVLIAAWGGLWLAMVFGDVDAGLSSQSKVVHDRAVFEVSRGRSSEAMRLINRAVELSPLDYRNYYLRAQLHLTMHQDKGDALQDFGRVRSVEPHYGMVCFAEGRLWLLYDPPSAMIPWAEGMRRYPVTNPNAQARYQEIVIDARPYPEIMPMLWKIADRAALQVVFLQMLADPNTLWNSCLDDFLAQHGGMEDLAPGLRRAVVNQWWFKGDKEKLVDFIGRHPHLMDAGWSYVALNLAQQGRHEEACKLAAKHLPLPARSATALSSDVPRLERQQVMQPNDPLVGVELYYAQRSAGDLIAARRTLERVLRLPNAPAFVPRELASVLSDLDDWRAAWEQYRLLVAAVALSSS